MTPSQKKDLHSQMITDCEERDTKMTEWEQNFIDSVSKQIATHSLSDRQAEILERIWEKVTS